jgi:hypothetical protein
LEAISWTPTFADGYLGRALLGERMQEITQICGILTISCALRNHNTGISLVRDFAAGASVPGELACAIAPRRYYFSRFFNILGVVGLEALVIGTDNAVVAVCHLADRFRRLTSPRALFHRYISAAYGFCRTYRH